MSMTGHREQTIHWNALREKLLAMSKLVAECTYKPGWLIEFGYEITKTTYRPYIQVRVTTEAEASMESAGPNKGKRGEWKGGKFYLSLHMCRQEIVSAVYGAIERAELHEIREWFRYKGASIFNPHLDPDVLAEVARKKASFNVRANAMTMEEVPKKCEPGKHIGPWSHTNYGSSCKHCGYFTED